jgi:pantetheine-phosphate adenylyltransferase
MRSKIINKIVIYIDMKVCIGGTFNFLHKGHKYLIDKAFQTAGQHDTVFIGVTNGKMLKKKKYVKPFNERVNIIKNYLVSMNFDKRSTIQAIYDRYGVAAEGDFDAIIVSPDTVNTAEEINKNRIKKGKKPLEIIKIPFILADDNKIISSTRILNDEIDEDGKIL